MSGAGGDAGTFLEEATKEPLGRTFLKYFAHGLAFSVLSFVLILFWAVLLGFLAVCGAYIGIAIGFVLLFVIVGFLNSGITRWLWFPVEGRFWVYFFHGLAFFLASLPVELAFFVVAYVVNPSLDPPLGIAVFLGSCPVYGFIGKWVAGHWRARAGSPLPLLGYWEEQSEDILDDTFSR